MYFSQFVYKGWRAALSVVHVPAVEGMGRYGRLLTPGKCKDNFPRIFWTFFIACRGTLPGIFSLVIPLLKQTHHRWISTGKLSPIHFLTRQENEIWRNRQKYSFFKFIAEYHTEKNLSHLFQIKQKSGLYTSHNSYPVEMTSVLG